MPVSVNILACVRYSFSSPVQWKKIQKLDVSTVDCVCVFTESIPHSPLLFSPVFLPNPPCDPRGKLSLFAEIGMSIPAPLTQVCSSPPSYWGNDQWGYLPSTPRGFHSSSRPSVPPGKERISNWEAAALLLLLLTPSLHLLILHHVLHLFKRLGSLLRRIYFKDNLSFLFSYWAKGKFSEVNEVVGDSAWKRGLAQAKVCLVLLAFYTEATHKKSLHQALVHLYFCRED